MVSTPLSRREAEFIEAMNYAKQHNRTAYNLILCFILKNKAEKNSPEPHRSAIRDSISNLPRNEYKRIIKIGRELQRDIPELSAGIESTIQFIRSELLTTHA